MINIRKRNCSKGSVFIMTTSDMTINRARHKLPADIGLLLGDVVMIPGLSSDEQVAVLGEQLRREFIQVVRYRNSGNR